MVLCTVKNEIIWSVCVCVCRSFMSRYIGVYQCGLWSIVQVCLWEGCVWQRFVIEA